MNGANGATTRAIYHLTTAPHSMPPPILGRALRDRLQPIPGHMTTIRAGGYPPHHAPTLTPYAIPTPPHLTRIYHTPPTDPVPSHASRQARQGQARSGKVNAPELPGARDHANHPSHACACSLLPLDYHPSSLPFPCPYGYISTNLQIHIATYRHIHISTYPHVNTTTYRLSDKSICRQIHMSTCLSGRCWQNTVDRFDRFATGFSPGESGGRCVRETLEIAIP